VDIVKNLGREAISIVGSVTNPDDVVSTVDKTIREFGRIHILVNNAGIVSWSSLLE
jgi:3-oxoacyl-[acyl-carrier protein] reductase